MLQGHFEKLRTNLEPSPTFADLISQKQNAVRERIVQLHQKPPETKLIGSLQKKTRIHPREGDGFDIDILVVLGSFTGWVPSGGITPQVALETIEGILTRSDRYAAMKPQQDAPTVVLEHADNVKVELVAAYKNLIGFSPDGTAVASPGRGYWVATPTGQWVFADYDYDAQCISDINAYCDGLLVPTIKMLKALRRRYFSEIKSFHLELLACQTIPAIVEWHRRNGQKVTHARLIRHFFGNARSILGVPVKLPGSFTPAMSADYFDVSPVDRVFSTIADYSEQIYLKQTVNEQVAAWRDLFDTPFPVTV